MSAAGIGLAPYYATDRVELYLADAADVLPGIATESVDLVVTDPPYGVQWRSNRRAQTFDDLVGDAPSDRAGVAAVMKECARVLRSSRHLYAFGPDDVLDGLPFTTRAELIWSKEQVGLGDLAQPWGAAHERITFATAVRSSANRAAGFGNLTARLRKGSVLVHKRPNATGVRHPSEKPLGLCLELIESSSRVDELVLDPFAGVGSTGVAAVLAGRRTILVEVDRNYAELARRRLVAAEDLYRQARKV